MGWPPGRAREQLYCGAELGSGGSLECRVPSSAPCSPSPPSGFQQAPSVTWPQAFPLRSHMPGNNKKSSLLEFQAT